MSLSRFPLPSIALVLTLDRASLPTRPSVIKSDFDPLQTIYPTVSNSPTDTEICQCKPVLPPVNEECFLKAQKDSAMNVKQSQGDDESDAQTVFNDKRPTTLRGFFSKENFDFMALATAIGKLLRGRPKDSMSRIGCKAKKVDAQE